MTDTPLRWGILGTGGIAAAFATDLAVLDDAVVAAVGSRTQESADAFGDRFAVPRRHASYDDLVADPGIDVVYVATPHPGHRAAVELALEAGKPVLCEKPFMMSAAEAQAVVSMARDRGLFLMEAMWTRFVPHVVRIRELLAEGALGQVRTVVADHGQWFAFDPAHRLFARELGGGALLDLGVYPVSFASMVLGTPSAVTAAATFTTTGVDAQTSMVLDHASGAQAVLTSTLEARTPTTATIAGTEARIEVDGDFYAPSRFRLVGRDGAVRETFDDVPPGRGLRFQAAEVARCLRAGLTESPAMPLDETCAVMTTMDEVRRQVGLSYPGEGAGATEGEDAR